MGWSKGSGIFDEIIDCLVETEIDDDQREIIYNKLVEVFIDYDCDTLDECIGKDDVFDRVFRSNFSIEKDDEEEYEG